MNKKILIITIILLLLGLLTAISFFVFSPKNKNDVICNFFSVESCPKECVICPTCAKCSSICCQTEKFCENIGFDKNWYENIKKKLYNYSKELGHGDYDFSLVHDGLTRRYLVHVPSSYDKNKLTPIVLVFHGGGGNADDSPEYFRLNEKSDEAGFIVVYPEGAGKKVFGKFFGTWNAGRCCGDSLKNNIDDVGFIDNMIKQLEKDFNIDAKRIFATGFSNGAQMSYRLACELSDKIAAIASGGSMGTFEYCNPVKPISIFAFSGTKDPCTPWSGGEMCGGCFTDFFRAIGLPAEYEYYRCDSVNGHIDKWKKMNNCTDEQEIIYHKKNTTCVSYINCQDGTEIILCTIVGGGHVWPGKKEYSAESCKKWPTGKVCTEWKKAVGSLIPDFNVNDMIWEFFKKHPMD